MFMLRSSTPKGYLNLRDEGEENVNVIPELRKQKEGKEESLKVVDDPDIQDALRLEILAIDRRIMAYINDAKTSQRRKEV